MLEQPFITKEKINPDVSYYFIILTANFMFKVNPSITPPLPPWYNFYAIPQHPSLILQFTWVYKLARAVHAMRNKI